MRIKIYLLGFLTILATLPLLAFQSGSGQIEWNEDRKLTWKDFKGRPNRGNPMDALTDSGIEYSWYCSGSNFSVEIHARFNPYKSWVKGNKSLELLKHEQLHFDITELFARKMRRAFDELENPCGMSKTTIRNTAREVLNAWHQMQRDYDHETAHSRNPDEQSRWATKVARELRRLDRYKST